MATDEVATTPETKTPGVWWMMTLRGVLLLVLSVMMFTWGRGVTLLALIELMGVYWIFGGVLDMSMGILGRTEKPRVWAIVGGIVSIIAGFFVMGHPAITGLVAGFWLTYFMGGAAFMVGIAQILEGRDGKRSLGSLIMGIFSVIFGILIIFNPVVTQSVLFFLLPFWALTAGLGAIVSSFGMRGADQTE
ncbi:MAG: DUF308 domain-containing protein [Caldilineaceae bacterium]|nr:DUF308 domain-containing protein [Caldilineaceae bacterium]